MRLLGIAALFAILPSQGFALVPLEGVLMGRVEQSLQPDPLKNVFTAPEAGEERDRVLHKLYVAELNEARDLRASCEHVGEAVFIDPQAEAVARRSVVAALQYVALDAVVKAAGTYARTLQLPEDEYARMADNMVAGSCSPNLSVYSAKLLRQNLAAAYESADNPLPSLPGLPYAPVALRAKADSRAAKENEFHQTVKLFRSLCSWGGDTGNYRLLPPLLASPQVMAHVFRHLEGERLAMEPRTGEVRREPSAQAVQVVCQDLVCRRVSRDAFERGFPRYLGSTGLRQDLRRLWCGHFRYQNYLTRDQHPQVKAWIAAQGPEDERNEVGHLWALFTGVPDLVVAQTRYEGLAQDLRLPMQERWERWAQQSLGRFSRGLLYEEPLEVRARAPAAVPFGELPAQGFSFDLDVTLGELDKVFGDADKLGAEVGLKLPRNWLRWVRQQWADAADSADPAVRERLRGEVAARLRPLLDAKRASFPGPLLTGGLEHVIGNALLEQLSNYRGPLFNELRESMLDVPVRFHYGLFALSYVRQKTVLEGKPAPAP